MTLQTISDILGKDYNLNRITIANSMNRDNFGIIRKIETDKEIISFEDLYDLHYGRRPQELRGYPISTCIKLEENLAISNKDLNVILFNAGILYKAEYIDNHTTKFNYYKLTYKGSEYGYNLKSGDRTHPRYYREKFKDLLEDLRESGYLK